MKYVSRIMLCLVLCLSLCAMAVTANAGAIRTGLFNAATLNPNDDGSAGPVGIGFNTNFFGTTYSQLYVNNNGNVTFNSSMSTFNPFGLSATSTPIIAPFFADVDTRSGGNPVTYGQATIGAQAAFGVDWYGVGAYSNQYNPLNYFQLVLIDQGGGDFDIEFNYDSIGWDRGTGAAVGYANGLGVYHEFVGSIVDDAFLDSGPNALALNTNTDVTGRYLFNVRNGVVVEPPLNAIPEPSTFLLLGAGLFGMVAMGRKRFFTN